MKKGNEIHDELFEGEGVDVTMEDAVEMAGTECFVQCIGQGLDLIGSDCKDKLAEVMEMLSTSTPPSNTFKFQFDLERTDTSQRVLMNSLVLRG